MINSTCGDGDGVTNASIVRGGPIYINNYELKFELCVDSSSLSTEDDILVNELKVFSDEELVEISLKAALEDESKKESSFQSSQKHSNARGESDPSLSTDSISQLERSEREGNESAALVLLDEENCCDATLAGIESRKRRCLKSEQSQPETSSNDIIIYNSSKNGKRRQANINVVHERCLEKAEEVLKIKQKQDQDKANARLHSLSRMINKTPVSSPEKTRGLTYLRSTNSERKVKPSNLNGYTAVQHPDVVLCIEVYHNIQHWTKTQEFLVLGRQFLTELRDKIYCITDQVIQEANQHDPSGYFVIEDMFCNDTRDKSAIDYRRLQAYNCYKGHEIDSS